MIAASEPLPDDLSALQALIVSERLGWAKTAAEKDAELTRVQDANARLWDILRQLRRAQFGRKSEKLHPDQLSLAIEEIEQAIGETEPAETIPDATLQASPTKPRSVNRGALPSQGPRIDC